MRGALVRGLESVRRRLGVAAHRLWSPSELTVRQVGKVLLIRRLTRSLNRLSELEDQVDALEDAIAIVGSKAGNRIAKDQVAELRYKLMLEAAQVTKLRQALEDLEDPDLDWRDMADHLSGRF